MIKNPQANAICERVHQVLGTMMRTAELDMADSVYEFSQCPMDPMVAWETKEGEEWVLSLLYLRIYGNTPPQFTV